MNGDPGDRLEAARTVLLSPFAAESAKVVALRQLIEHKGDSRAREVLNAAAAWPGNARLLHLIVRTFGYLHDRTAVDDLAGYVLHSDPAVVSNAVKAAAALDPDRAVVLALPALRGTAAQAAGAAALALAERCRAEADRVMGELARAASQADRVAALTYFRALPPEIGHPRIGEMLGAEKDPDLRDLMQRILAVAAPGEPHTGTAAGSPAAQVVSSRPSKRTPVFVAPSVEQPAAKVAETPAPAPRVSPSPPVRRTTGRTPALVTETLAVSPPVASLRSLAMAALVAVALYGAHWFSGTQAPPAVSGGPPEAPGLGRVGQSVRVEGTICGVHPQEEILAIEISNQRVVSAFFPGQRVRHLATGQKVTVEGILEKVSSERLLVLRGTAVSPR